MSISTGTQKKALVIGISEYTKLEGLNICKNDGTEVYKVLSSLGYEISDKNKLLGESKGAEVKDLIYDFFGDIGVNPDDTLLFYYSGHGVFDIDGDVYLASSDIDPEEPYRRGFSMEELTKMMQRSISTRVVVILDCCHSGSAKISKGNAEEAANKAIKSIDEKSKKLQGQRKCILAACQATQFAYTTGEHSLFTQYLLQGLNGDTESIDNDGNVTPESLGNYVERKIMKLPDNKRRQRPITRAEGSGNIILASYPELKPKKIEDILASMLKLLRESKVQEFNKMREENSVMLPKPVFSMENLHGLHIAGANLSNANLNKADLSEADLQGANLSHADLVRADLEGANLSNTNCSNAVLEAANLANANLTKANLSNTNLTKANLYHATIFSGDLQQAKLNGAIEEPPDKTREAGSRKGIHRIKTKISITVGTATAIAVVLILGVFNYYNHPTTYLPPTSQYALLNKGLALDNLGNHTGAIMYYDKALAIDPKYEEALYYKGDALNSVGNYTQSIQVLDKALAIDPNDEYALNDVGLDLNSLGNHKGAITYFDKALTLEPKDETYLNNKGWALDGLGNYNEALVYLDKALAIDPKDEDALDNIGWALDGLGNYKAAIPYLDKALAIDPKYEDALYNKGDTLNYLGNYKQAMHAVS